MGSYNTQQVQAVLAYGAKAANGPAIAAQPGKGAAQVVRAALAAGLVPGLAAHHASSKATVKGLGRAVRNVPRKAGMGVGRGNTYGTATTPAAKVLHTAQGKLAHAAKAQAAQAAQAAKAAAKAQQG